MRTFFDTSAFAKRFVEEPGSDKVDQICHDASEIALSIICIPEILSALNRRLREGYIDQDDYVSAKARLTDEIEDIIILNITPDVVNTSIELLEKHVLRTMDAIHISCAVAWRPDLFVSSDRRQVSAAQKSGLSVQYIN